MTVDERGHAPLYAVDVGTRRTPPADRRRSDHRPRCSARTAATLYALRTSYTDPGFGDRGRHRDRSVRELRSPVRYPALPGPAARTCQPRPPTAPTIRGCLLLPERYRRAPAPLALWIHGGPLSSWNAWSWRWCPWLLVCRGYAVLLPDPALSTGYGQEFVQRGWGGGAARRTPT